jgi:hypothetical protein
VTVVSKGRGTAVRPRHTRLWLPDPDGVVRVAEKAVTAADTPAADAAVEVPAADTPAWVREAAG